MGGIIKRDDYPLLHTETTETVTFILYLMLIIHAHLNQSKFCDYVKGKLLIKMIFTFRIMW